MVKVHFTQDSVKTITVMENARLLDALLERNIPVKMFCGGKGLCATCHCYVTSNMDGLTPVTSQEALTLSILTGAKANSRLSCQARIIGGDIEVELPQGLYIESASDLEALVGKRTQVPILHPVTGDTLIEEAKIITRTLIMQLSDVDFDVSSIDATKPK
jgi:ferredoxin